MAIQITTYGMSQLNLNAGIITLDLVKLGSGHNYLPVPSDTNIHGSEVFSTTPSPSEVVNANVVKYSAYVDYSAAPFQFGEVGLYHNGNLFALGSFTGLVAKLAPSGSSLGNSIRIDIYLSIVGTNYNMWFDLAESNNQFRIATLQSPDLLPPSQNATPNTYIIQGPSSNQGPVLAFTDRNGLWSFDAYQFASNLYATVKGSTTNSIIIDLSDYSTNMRPDFFGAIILEFVTGALYSICRYVQSVTISGTSATLNLSTQILEQPAVGDKIQVMRRTNSATLQSSLPIATRTTLGGVIVGTGLGVDADGKLYVESATLGAVTSINNMRGDVILNATNLPGLHRVARTGDYNDLANKPNFTGTPVMSQSVIGGARLPTNGNLVINNSDVLDLGFAPIKTINGIGADVDGKLISLDGLVFPKTIPANANLNSYIVSGLYFAADSTVVVNKPSVLGDATLEVVRDGADTAILQRWNVASSIYVRRKKGATWSPWSAIGSSAWSAEEIPNASNLNTYNRGGLYFSKPGGVTPPPPPTVYSYLSVLSMDFYSTTQGHVIDYPNIDTTMFLTLGGNPDENNWVFSQSTSAGLTVLASNNNRTAKVTGFADGVDTATLTFTATRNGYPTQTKVFTANKDKSGGNGAGEGVVTSTLTQEPIVLDADFAGHVTNYVGKVATLSIFIDGVNDSSNWTVVQTPSAGLTVTASDSNRTATITAITDGAANGTVTFVASKPTYADVTKVLHINKNVDATVPPIILTADVTEGFLLRAFEHTFKDNAGNNLTPANGVTGNLRVRMVNNFGNITDGLPRSEYIVTMPPSIPNATILTGWSNPFPSVGPGGDAYTEARVTFAGNGPWVLVFPNSNIANYTITP